MNSCATPNIRHPERSPEKREAILQTQSNDPVFAGGTTGPAGNFRIVIRFFDDSENDRRAPSRN